MAADLTSLAAQFHAWTDERAAELAVFRHEHPSSVSDRLELGRGLMALLAADGWSLRGWPEDVGGSGGDIRERAVLYDQLEGAGIGVPEQFTVIETVGPAVIRFAPTLAKELLLPYLRGEELWCQGFSEPEAGSDLASLRCRAVPTGDGFLVSGQKIWSSYGHLADRMVALVRTGSAESRHRGLTMLMVDLSGPGITRRPIRLANGEEELSEVFFDDAPVAGSSLIGEVDKGWSVAMYLLQFERGMYAWLRMARLRGRLARLARRVDPADPIGCREVGRALAAQRALRARTWHTIARLAEGETPGPETSVDKVLLATAEQAVADAARAVDLAAFTFATEDLDDARSEWFYTRAASIYGGSAEVQRSILADHVLKLPSEGKA